MAGAFQAIHRAVSDPEFRNANHGLQETTDGRTAHVGVPAAPTMGRHSEGTTGVGCLLNSDRRIIIRSRAAAAAQEKEGAETTEQGCDVGLGDGGEAEVVVGVVLYEVRAVAVGVVAGDVEQRKAGGGDVLEDGVGGPVVKSSEEAEGEGGVAAAGEPVAGGREGDEVVEGSEFEGDGGANSEVEFASGGSDEFEGSGAGSWGKSAGTADGHGLGSEIDGTEPFQGLGGGAANGGAGGNSGDAEGAPGLHVDDGGGVDGTAVTEGKSAGGDGGFAGVGIGVGKGLDCAIDGKRTGPFDDASECLCSARECQDLAGFDGDFGSRVAATCQGSDGFTSCNPEDIARAVDNVDHTGIVDSGAAAD